MISKTADEFLAQRRIAVAGVSREPAGHGANNVYRRLRARGYEVFAVNPKAARVEGDPCYRDLRSIPGGVDAVVIGTPPAASEAVVREAHELGVGHVWMHGAIDAGSVSDAAVEYCRKNGVRAIVGGCPLMYDGASDIGHRCMGWVLGVMGRGAIET